ncbi:MAG: HAD family hydrolase [Chloroflexi bacterium]|nr:MAG: HAD family hydrolase [Chloroflexota bacterium]
MHTQPSLATLDGFIFDLDGTVYLGDHLLPGAAQTIADLRARGKRVLFVSNKPVDARRTYADKLTRLGIPATEDDVITSAFVLAHTLAHHAPGLRYYVIGEANFLAELRSHGLTVVNDRAEWLEQNPLGVIQPDGIDAVVVALDRTLDYRKLNTVYQALRRGARYFATNADKSCPMPGGDVPDAGATIAAYAHITGRTPELIAGKPSPLILQVALERLGLPAARCLMAGDRLETDMQMGHDAGMATALVLTGVTTRAEAAAARPAPSLILENLGELMGQIDSGQWRCAPTS